MAIRRVLVLTATALIFHLCINAVVCDITSGTGCQGTECPWEELDHQTTCINSQLLQNLTTTLASILQNQLMNIHITHQNGSSSCERKGEESTNQSAPLDQQSTTTRDCSDILAQGHTANGIYQINPEMIPVAPSSVETHPITVYCDMETDGGGWTVFQRRFIGAVGFHRDWSDYKRGFGYVNGDYWLGLQSIHLITSLARYEFRVDLEDFEGNRVYATYNRFHLEGEESNYKIYLGTYAGTAGNSMAHIHGQDFSTKDRDHDAHSSHCAQVSKGGWWHTNCAWANLNSPYIEPYETSIGMSWYYWRNNYEVLLAKAEMKIRRID